MKIAIDARLYRSSVAGIGRYSQNLIKNLLEIDPINQYILIMTPEDAEEFKKRPEAKKDNVEVKVVDIAHYSLSEQFKFKKILESLDCDLVHFTNFNHAMGFRGRFIVTIHDLTLLFYPGRSKRSLIHKIGYRWMLSSACKNSQKIIAVSKNTKKDIQQVFNVPASKITVVYEAADDAVFKSNQVAVENLKTRYHLGNEPVFLYVGQWRPHKNVSGLIQAFELLRQKMPAKLAIVGKIDPAYPEIITQVNKSSAKKDIILTGFVSEQDLNAWYGLSHAFVFPSFYEGFGLPGLEAMAAKTAVLASDRTSLPEIYQDGALYFDPFKISDISAKMEQVITDQALRRKIIENGYHILNQFSWEKTARETLNVYKSIK